MRILLRLWFLVLLVPAVPWAAHAQTANAPLQFVITGGDPDLNRETVAILREAHHEMVEASGIFLRDTIHVVYVSAAQSFDSVLGGHFPDWGVAAAIAERHLIVVRSPADFPLGRSLAEILRHELAHLHLDAVVDLRMIPRWMHEGYAQQIAHEWRFGDDWTVARAAFTKRIIPLRDIDGVNSFGSASAHLAYTQSYLAMGHFLSTYGWEGLRLFAAEIRERRDWDQAFAAATGTDYAGFESEFLALIDARYNWAVFLGDTVLLWIGLSGAFVVFYFIKRHRTGLKKKEWERAEALEDLLYAPFERPDDWTDPENRDRSQQ